jgi:hypothetical protein
MTLITVDTAELGRRGGHARAASLTAKQRRNSASDAARARWDAYYRLHPDKLKAKLAKKKKSAK